jgi:phospholipase C
MATGIQNVFVLMLENRAFDHLLGFSGVTGTDAVSGRPTSVQGLSGVESNRYGGQTYLVTPGAAGSPPVDPGHEFLDVLEQLCGADATHAPGAAYPAINNGGFVSDYAVSHTDNEGNAPGDLGSILKGFSPGELPILNFLAKQFAVCDHWFASVPGPTWPNRMFAFAASSSGLDHSPTTAEMLTWETIDGIEFSNGSSFDALGRASNAGWRIYAGDEFPVVAALKGITLGDIHTFDEFAADIAGPSYPWLYTWIEPNYGDIVSGTYRGGNSQHPLDGVTQGEKLIKSTYEALRSSPRWDTGLLIITWDEHGGFYDHVAPPRAIPPGDTTPGSKYNQYGFTFAQYGVRVPAVIVSPRIPANTVDHRPYDHSSIPATLEAAYGLPPLTARDRAANPVSSLLSLARSRADTPVTLPAPVAPPAGAAIAARVPAPDSSVDSGSLPGFVHIAMRHDVALSAPAQRPAILTRVQSIRTRRQADQYIQEVRARVQAARAAGR